MFVPEMPVTVYVVCKVDFEMLPLVMLQTPLVDVVHFTDDPPTVKPPLTVAPETATPLASFTPMLAVARQPLRTFAAAPVSEPTDTKIMVVSGGGLTDDAPT
jgi:hypothetical protein